MAWVYSLVNRVDKTALLGAVGGILCAGIGIGQYWQTQKEIQARATMELLNARCDTQLSDGISKIYAFKKKLKGENRLLGKANCYADHFAAALWFAHNSNSLDDVFNRDGDEVLTQEEMLDGLEASGCPDHLSQLLVHYFFTEGEDAQPSVNLKKRCKELKDEWAEAEEVDRASLRMMGLYYRLWALVGLGMVTEDQAMQVPGKNFSRGFIKIVEPLHQTKSLRILGHRWDEASDLFRFTRKLYNLEELPEPHRNDKLRFLVPMPVGRWSQLRTCPMSRLCWTWSHPKP